MLDPDDLVRMSAAYGVAEEQIRRDHLISHSLRALSILSQPVIFFGGTALARTYLAQPELGGRLSEDIDLMAEGRPAVAQSLAEGLPRLLQREFPGTRWDPPLVAVRSIEPGELVTGDGLRVRVQLLDLSGAHSDFRGWPVEERQIETFYRDVPGRVVLTVPTLTAFAAMKTAAYADRRTARDLYDLAALARLGALTAEAGVLVKRMTGVSPASHMFARLPVALAWSDQLAHQTSVLPAPEDCLADVRRAYGDVLGWFESTSGS